MNQSKNVERIFYQDPFNSKKKWEIVILKGGYYLRQYICGKQFGRGVRITKRQLKDLGIWEYEKVKKKNGKAGIWSLQFIEK